jgi:hypothetical protein
MENPYQSPEEPGGASAGRSVGLVHHVRAVAILMLVQGTLELLFGVTMGILATTLPQAFMEIPQEPNSPPPEQVGKAVGVIYGGMAVAALIAAVLHIAAGVQNLRLRGRVLGFVALIGGLVSGFTCWCFPTAAALGVYGLIVYFNGAVSQAFRMADSGRTASEILADFGHDWESEELMEP